MSKNHLRVAAARSSGGSNVSDDLTAALSTVGRAAEADVRLAMLPEATMSWFGDGLRNAGKPLSRRGR